MSRSARDFISETSGQVVVIVALAMAGMIVGVGLAIDTGQLFSERRDAQSAADAAAWAGAVVLFDGGTNDQAEAAALADATLNGYTTGAGITVTADAPPATGTYQTVGGYIEVTITQDVDTAFLSGAAAGLTRIKARAVAGVLPLETGHAIHTLNYTDPQSLKLSGGAVIEVSGAGILVNSSDDRAALKVVGTNAQICMGDYVDPNCIEDGNVVEVVGAVDANSTAIVPDAIVGVEPEDDPLTYLDEPGLDANGNLDAGLTTYTNFTHTSGATVTINPGVYNGGIKQTSSGTLILNPGLYILRGGGLDVSGQGKFVAHDVTIFNTISTYPNAGGSCSSISLTGGGRLELSAAGTAAEATASGYQPTADAADAEQGMLIWQDDACTETMQLAGNGELTDAGDTVGTTGAGTIYLPQASAKITGNSGVTSVSLQIVAQNLELAGSSSLVIAYDPAAIVQVRAPSLYE